MTILIWESRRREAWREEAAFRKSSDRPEMTSLLNKGGSREDAT